MGEKRARKMLTVIGPKDDPCSLYYQMLQFLEAMRVSDYSEYTIERRGEILLAFVIWCDDRGLHRPQEITRLILERYQHSLRLYRKKNGQPLSARSHCTRMSPVVVWFRWLIRNNRILSNPAADLIMPKKERRLPKNILNVEEVEQILNHIDTKTGIGIRDRAMLEILYSTGIRRMELCNLQLDHIDYERGTLMVRQGKNKRDRLLPIGDRALAWVAKYLEEVRKIWALSNDNGMLFITVHGNPIHGDWLTHMTSDRINQSGIGKTGSCHIFRHTMATLMLENGADIRYVQEMLGHVELTTTQIYTRVTILKLKEIHTLTHPARLERVVNKLE